MQHGEKFNRLLSYAIRNNVGCGLNHEFSRAGKPAWFTKLRKIGKMLYDRGDQGSLLSC